MTSKDEIDSLRRLMVRRSLERVLLYLPAALGVEFSLRVLLNQRWAHVVNDPATMLQGDGWISLWLVALIGASFFAVARTLRVSAAAAAMVIPLLLTALVVAVHFGLGAMLRYQGPWRTLAGWLAMSAAWMYGLCRTLPALAGCEAALLINVEKREVRKELV